MRGGTAGAALSLELPRILLGMPGAFVPALPLTRDRIMGTEILTVGLAILLYGVCTLFVRICDRI